MIFQNGSYNMSNNRVAQLSAHQEKLKFMRNLLAFPDDARVWIYQADRPFAAEDINLINTEIEAFCAQWTSHNSALRAIGGVMHDIFVVLVADESAARASGCSIDKSVAFIKALEQRYSRRLLDRQQIAWLDENEALQIMPLSGLKQAVAEGRISPDTIVFDNLVSNRKDFLHGWTVRLGDSWMKKFM